MARRDIKAELGRAERQVKVLHAEVKELSKKKPDDAINAFKLKLINEILGKANELLESDDRPFSDFDLFDDESLPSNSDVVLILAQYSSALRRAHIER